MEALDKAVKNIRIADHMINVTYDVVKEPKLLLSILDNIFLAMTNAMAALLYLDREYKRIPEFKDNFEGKINAFSRYAADRHKIDREYIGMMRDIKELLVAHRTSPIEFSKKDRFVICSDNYHMKTITAKQIKDYVAKAKLFIQDIKQVVDNGRKDI